MKKILVFVVLMLGIFTLNLHAQKVRAVSSDHGRNLNVGIGLGYSGYAGNPASFVAINYEFEVAKNFTLAPFIGFSSYAHNYYWGNNNNPYRYYTYRETSIPMGLKGVYYFDDLLKANAKWDFYAGASIGFALYNHTWENGYNGNLNIDRSTSPLYLAAHAGARYHFNGKLGAFLDLSPSFSTIGLSFKL